MQHVNDYDKDRARRARIQAEYEDKVKGQLFIVGKGYDTHTEGATPQDNKGRQAAIQSVKINLK